MYFYSEKSPLILDRKFIHKVTNFYSSDSSDIYKKNLSTHGKSWKYYDNTIKYRFNSLGYRTKEISHLSNDFILTFGCSYTEGVGLHQSDVWAEQLTNDLGIDLYNAAKQASGMDFQFLNAMRWTSANAPLPKMVIVQWPHKSRKRFATIQENNELGLSDESYKKTIDGKWWTTRYVVDTGEMHLNVLSYYEGFNNIWNLRNIPVLNFTWDTDLQEHLTSSMYKVHHVDCYPENQTLKARDDSHDGDEIHLMTAQKLKKIIELGGFTFKI